MDRTVGRVDPGRIGYRARADNRLSAAVNPGMYESTNEMKVLLLLTLLCAGCGGNSTGPTVTPQPPTVTLPPVNLNVTMTGHLTATNGGQPLPGVQAALGATTATTDGAGSFSSAMLPASSVMLSLTGIGIVPRTLRVAMLNTRDLQVDAIALGSGFDLNFYRQFVRDANESASLRPLRRWTQNPSIYLQTNGLADTRTLDMIESVARAAVPQWTNGQFNVVTVERGPDSRVGQDGWISVLFNPETTYCGVSDVGRSGGAITLYPRTTACACNGLPIRARTVRHEFGHAMGFYHTDGIEDVMYRSAQQCDTPLSARERYHAAIAYSRSVGNADPDEDPAGQVSLAPMRVVQ